MHISQKRFRIDIALANQNMVSGVTAMRHIWNQLSYSDHAMVSLTVDFETIDRCQGIFKYPSEVHEDVNCQSIIKSTITKCLIEELPKYYKTYDYSMST